VSWARFFLETDYNAQNVLLWKPGDEGGPGVLLERYDANDATMTQNDARERSLRHAKKPVKDGVFSRFMTQ
jgi:hypothetical protein